MNLLVHFFLYTKDIKFTKDYRIDCNLIKNMLMLLQVFKYNYIVDDCFIKVYNIKKLNLLMKVGDKR